MRPVQKAEQQVPHVSATEFKADEVFEAIYLAGRDAIARHKAVGQSIVIWRDGKVVVVPPEKIEIWGFTPMLELFREIPGGVG